MIDDVMAGYRKSRRWRHGGLQDLREGAEGGIFLSVEDWHEPVQINLGPNVGDITTRQSWYVSVVSTFPNAFPLFSEFNLYDLNKTNLDWRRFQQNYHGVVFVQK